MRNVRRLNVAAAVVLAGIAVAGSALAERTPGTCGDPDGSGAVSVADGVQILRAGAGLVNVCSADPHLCDLDGDGELSVTDGVSALRLAAGLAATARCDRGAPRTCEPPAPSVPVFGRRADFPPSLSIPHSCGAGGSVSSNYAMPVVPHGPDSTEELHVIGVYEGTLPDGFSPGLNGRRVGVVRVEVGRTPKPVILFLSAVEPVRWQLTIAPEASVARIIMHGQYEQHVAGVPPGVAVASWSPSSGFGCMYGWEVEANLGGCDYWTLIHEIRAFTGIIETSFQACYRGDRFEVPHWTGAPPVCRADTLIGDEAVARADVRLEGCEGVAAEKDYCLTLMSDFSTSTWNLAVLGLESGNLCALSTMPPGLTLYPEASSLGWRGEMLYVCAEQGLVRIALRDGAWEAAQLPCQAVSADADRLYVMRSWRDPLHDHQIVEDVYAYASYDGMLAGDFDRAYDLPFSSRITVQGDRLFGAWHSTDIVDVVSLASGAAIGSIKLRGYDDLINGIAVTEDNRLVIARFGPELGSTVVVFDARTGERIREIAVPRMIMGLACAARAD